MKYVIIALLNFTVSSTAGYKDHRALVFESSVEVTRTERVEHEHSVELAAHHFTSAIPKELAELVRQHTEIECKKVGAIILVTDNDGVFGKNPVMLGDSYSSKADTKTRKLVRKQDFSYTFKRVFELSGETSFVAEGAFEFSNNLIDQKCYVICRMTGTRDDKGAITGASEWIGPVKLGGAKTTMALPIIFNKDQTTKN